jgi:acetoin utilization protein AcuB
MFSLYGISGQNFRGTLEQLAALPGVTGSRRLRAIAQEGEEAPPTFVTRLDGRSGGGHAGGRETAAQPYQDMLELDRERERGRIYFASQIMNRDVVVLSAETSAPIAWRSLLAQGLHQAPVLDAASNLVGLVTERDLLTTFKLEREQSRSPLARHVGDVMISPVVCADPDTDIRRIAQVMLEFDLPAVPVVTETRALLGLVSRGDILRAVSADPPLSLWG